MIQARTIHDALQRLLPGTADSLRQGLERLTADLEETDHRVARMLEPVRGRRMFVYHPAYGYLAGAYGLEQVAVEVGGKEPSAKQLAELIAAARRDGVKIIFYQPQFSRSSAETLAREIGGRAVALDPLSPDYLDNLERMATAISTALEGEAN
jgi:zinc transport system substrate-binding protein